MLENSENCVATSDVESEFAVLLTQWQDVESSARD
jgi:hypothetical protein